MEWIAKTDNRLLMLKALDTIKGKWKTAAIASAVYLLISFMVQSVPGIGWLISLIVNGPLFLGFAIFSLTLAKGQQPRVSMVFDGFSRFKDSVLTYLLMLLFIVLWSLLLIVPGIMAMFSYSMAFFLLADDETIEPMEAIRISKEMMFGNRWKLAGLIVRFLGWILVGIITFGIGFIWILPYMAVSFAHFYQDLITTDVNNEQTKPTPASKVETPEDLSDLVIDRVMALDRSLKDRENLRKEIESTVAALNEVSELPREEIEQIAAEVLAEYRKKQP